MPNSVQSTALRAVLEAVERHEFHDAADLTRDAHSTIDALRLLSDPNPTARQLPFEKLQPHCDALTRSGAQAFVNARVIGESLSPLKAQHKARGRGQWKSWAIKNLQRVKPRIIGYQNATAAVRLFSLCRSLPKLFLLKGLPNWSAFVRRSDAISKAVRAHVDAHPSLRAAFQETSRSDGSRARD